MKRTAEEVVEESGTVRKRRGDAFLEFRKDEDRQSRDATQKEIAPWYSQKLNAVSSSAVRLHNQIIAFYRYLEPSQEEHQRRTRVLHEVKEALSEGLERECTVHSFGSYMSRLYLPSADIDIVVECKEGSDRTIFEKLLKVIERPGWADQIQAIRNAKVPIIKFLHKESGLLFDLSVNKMDGVVHMAEIGRALRVYPELRYLILLLKCFLKQRDLGQTYQGGIGSFLLFCMCLAFLRRTRMQGKQDKQDKQDKLLSQILVDFLEFYSNTKEDLTRQRIDMRREGCLQPRSDGAFFSLISPQDETHDIGAAAYRMRQIFSIFRNRLNVLQNTNFGKQSILRYFINPSNQPFIFLKQI